MNSLALFGELSGSFGSFLPRVPMQRAGVCRPIAGNLCTAGRRALWRQSLNIMAEQINTTTSVRDVKSAGAAISLNALRRRLAGRRVRLGARPQVVSFGPCSPLESTLSSERTGDFWVLWKLYS